MSAFNDTLGRVYQLVKMPGRADQFVRLERPTLLEKIGDNWKVVQQGRVGFSPHAPAPLHSLFGEPAPAPVPAVQSRPRLVAPIGKGGASSTEPVAGAESPKSALREEANPSQRGEASQAVPPALTAPVGEGPGPKAPDLPL